MSVILEFHRVYRLVSSICKAVGSVLNEEALGKQVLKKITSELENTAQILKFI